MAREKSVSVRFTAIGGEAVKAEMRGIGVVGKQAMQDVASSTRPASASLDEISATVARARDQLEQMAARAAAAASTLRASGAAATPMVEQINRLTGVTPAIGQTTAEFLRQGQALDDLRAKFNPVFGVIRQYRQSVSEVKAAHFEGAISADEMGAAIDALRTKALASITAIKGLTAAKSEAARAAEQAAQAQMREAQRLDDLRAKYNPVYAATRQYRAALADLTQLKAAGAITSHEYSAALEMQAERMRAMIAAAAGADNAMQQVSRSSRGATLRMQQMFFQVNDIGVSLAGGMNPFVVMAQQGTQIAQIYGFGNGGVTGIFRDLGGLVSKLPGPLKIAAVGIAAGAAAIAGLQHEINEVSGVTVTFGDTALAVWQIIRDGVWTWIKPAADKISEWFSAAWDKVVAGVKWVGNGIINGIRVAVDGVGTAIGMVPALFSAAFNQAVSNVMSKMHDLVWWVAYAVNGIAETFNQTFGTSLATDSLSGVIGQLDAASGTYFQAAQAARDSAVADWDGFNQRAAETLASDPMGDLFGSIRGRAEENARNREASEADGAGGGSGGGAAAQASAVSQLVEQLQRELIVLRETDPLKKKMLEYSDQLAGATDAERQAVFGLVQELDRAQFGWEAVGRALAEYAQESKRLGDDIGAAMVNAFTSAEDAFREFVKTGKADFKGLVQALLADLATLAFRSAVLGPIAGALGVAFGSGGSGLATVLHGGGMVGQAGTLRPVSAMAFAAAPRLHSGGWPGLRHDEVPAILQRGERVLSRGEVAQSARRASRETVEVVVTLDESTGRLGAFVRREAGGVAQAVVGAYNTHMLPQRIQQIGADTRVRGR